MEDPSSPNLPIVQEFLYRRFPKLQQQSSELRSSAMAQFMIFEDAMELFIERNEHHNDVWSKSGWLDQLQQMKHKAKRILNMYLHDFGQRRSIRTLDDAFDLINYTAFFIRLVKRGDKFGEEL